MSLVRTAAAILMSAVLPFTASGQVFDPGKLKHKGAAAPNELAVLGTPHLSGWPESFQPASLDALIDRLAAWRPRVIAIESLSGMQCDSLRRNPARYAASAEDYCPDTAPARQATGLDVPDAIAAADKMLADWPAAPTAGQRRRLAALFLAAGETSSALVQWLRLPEAERHEGDGLDAALVARLETVRMRRNEVYLIAAPLAARLGLERVYAMDDHSSDRPVPDEKAFGEVITKLWNNPATDRRHKMGESQLSGIATSEGVIAVYRAANAPSQARLIYDSDFGAALTDVSPQQFGRQYVGGWETRNLRMAANIRDAIAATPGVRTLVIVGSAHKWYLESYLDRMHDMRIVDVETLLR